MKHINLVQFEALICFFFFLFSQLDLNTKKIYILQNFVCVWVDGYVSFFMYWGYSVVSALLVGYVSFVDCVRFCICDLEHKTNSLN